MPTNPLLVGISLIGVQVNHYVAPQQTVSTAAVPAGWYPDPYASTPGAERWWDGVAWSEEFARSAQPGPTGPTVPDGFAAPAPARESLNGQETSQYATLAMVIGGFLIVARLFYMSGSSTNGAGPGYGTGAFVGNIIGMFLCAWLFSWGLTRRDAYDNYENEKMFPIAIGITVVGVLIGLML